MAKDKKEKILTAALEMFSQKGYEGTNIRELSASLGLVKSGITNSVIAIFMRTGTRTQPNSAGHAKACFI